MQEMFAIWDSRSIYRLNTRKVNRHKQLALPGFHLTIFNRGDGHLSGGQVHEVFRPLLLELDEQ
jgi:hypothetical protein